MQTGPRRSAEGQFGRNFHVGYWAQVYAPRLRERTKLLEQWVKSAGEAEWIKDEIIWFSQAMLTTLDMFDTALRESTGEPSAVPRQRSEPHDRSYRS